MLENGQAMRKEQTRVRTKGHVGPSRILEGREDAPCLLGQSMHGLHWR